MAHLPKGQPKRTAQKDSALACWLFQRTANASQLIRKKMIVALARKLLIAPVPGQGQGCIMARTPQARRIQGCGAKHARPRELPRTHQPHLGPTTERARQAMQKTLDPKIPIQGKGEGAASCGFCPVGNRSSQRRQILPRRAIFLVALHRCAMR